MARKSQHSFAKRQREQKKAEKAALKQMRREQRLNPTDSEGEPDAAGQSTDGCELTESDGQSESQNAETIGEPQAEPTV